MFQIAPSILAADFSRLGTEIEEAERAGAGLIHIDVMDGHFVPNLTMGPVVVEACRRSTRLPLEVHLMVETPENFAASFVEAGADRLIVHAETGYHLHRTLAGIRDLGCQSGVAVNPATPLTAIQPILGMVDLMLVMTINPGFAGQRFLPETLPKIRELRRLLDEINPNIPIEVDGGVTDQTLPQALEAGAQIFVAATAIFKHPDGIAGGIQALKACLPAAA